MASTSGQGDPAPSETERGDDTIEAVIGDLALLLDHFHGQLPPELAVSEQAIEACVPFHSPASPPPAAPSPRSGASSGVAHEETVYLTLQQMKTGCDVMVRGVRYRLPGGLQPQDVIRLSNGLVLQIASQEAY